MTPQPHWMAVAVVAMAALATACTGSRGSGSSPSAGGSSNSPAAVSYSACMRSHGVPNFPDPDSSGRLPKSDAQHLGVGPSLLRSAQRACQHLLPSAAGSFQQETLHCLEDGDCPQALVQQILTVQRRYAVCMRSHGFPQWPDPTLDSQGRPFFDVSKAGMSRTDTRSSNWTSSDRVCVRLVGIDGDVPVDLR